MQSIPKSALIAMSGGVDSAVAAMLAQREGLDCTGVTIKLLPDSDGSETSAAEAVAVKLGIPFLTLDLSGHFAEDVIQPFIADYREGRTPNPCVVCNKHIKFGRLLEESCDMGKDFIITGHYARIERTDAGRYLLKKGVDSSKDQSYVLYTLTQEQLARIKFPLGGKTKREVRELALDMKLDNAQKDESQDICFIPDGDYVRFITEYTGKPPRKGRFVDVNGKTLGENNGIIAYTIGQRRGLGISMPHPLYVLELRPSDDTVVVGKDELLYSKSFKASNINLIPVGTIDAPLRAQVKIRYTHPAQPAMVRQVDEDTLSVEFDEPQRAITRGQAAVIYDGDYVIGGGTIV
jgi:tRNA-specific 2-thiouridylase